MVCIWPHSDQMPLLPAENILWLCKLQRRKIVSYIQKERSFCSWQRSWAAFWGSLWRITKYPQRPDSQGISTWGCEGEGHCRWAQLDQGFPQWWWDISSRTEGTGGSATLVDVQVLWEWTLSALLCFLFPYPWQMISEIQCNKWKKNTSQEFLKENSLRVTEPCTMMNAFYLLLLKT